MYTHKYIIIINIIIITRQGLKLAENQVWSTNCKQRHFTVGICHLDLCPTYKFPDTRIDYTAYIHVPTSFFTCILISSSPPKTNKNNSNSSAVLVKHYFPILVNDTFESSNLNTSCKPFSSRALIKKKKTVLEQK